MRDTLGHTFQKEEILVTGKPLTRCSISSVTMKTLIPHCKPIGVAKDKKTESNTKYCWDCRTTEPSFFVGGNAKSHWENCFYEALCNATPRYIHSRQVHMHPPRHIIINSSENEPVTMIHISMCLSYHVEWKQPDAKEWHCVTPFISSTKTLQTNL